MKRTFKIISLLLCIVLAASMFAGCKGKTEPEASPNPDTSAPVVTNGGGEAEKGVLRVGMECDFPPHNWTQLAENEFTVPMPDGTYVDGYDVQIAKKIADELGYELQVVKVDWDGLPPSLTSKKIDLIIAGMTDNEERRLILDFTDIYWASDLVVVVMKDGPYAGATSLADFTGTKITAQMETLHYDLIDMIPDVDKQQAMADFPTMLISLTSGRVDGYLAERPAAISAQLSNPNVTFVEFEGDKGFGEEMPVSIGLRQGEETLKEQINEILATISVEERQQLMEEAVSRQPLQG